MKQKKKLKLFNNPLKQFILAFLIIHLVGIGLNIILYFLKIPSGIEKIINTNPLQITTAIICYLVFNAMLYVVIKIRFMIAEK